MESQLCGGIVEAQLCLTIPSFDVCYNMNVKVLMNRVAVLWKALNSVSIEG